MEEEDGGLAGAAGGGGGVAGAGGKGHALGGEEGGDNFLIGAMPHKYLVYWNRFLSEIFCRDSSLPAQASIKAIFRLF
jgi:hypothetical protein